jgi:hypothetical protein
MEAIFVIINSYCVKSNGTGQWSIGQNRARAQLVGNEGRFAFSFASSSNLRCFCFSSMYLSRAFRSDFCMINEMIQSSTTIPKAIKMYLTILPPVSLLIILIILLRKTMSMTRQRLSVQKLTDYSPCQDLRQVRSVRLWQSFLSS